MIFQGFASVFGTLMVFGLLAWIYHANSNHWRYLAAHYARPWQEPLAEKTGQLVLYGKYHAAKAHNGVTKFGIHRDGVAIRLTFPLDAMFCEPLFIPFRDIKGWGQSWFVNADSVELEAKGAPDVKLVMTREDVDWLQRHSRVTMDVRRNTLSPNDAKPTGWWLHTMIFPIVAIPTVLLGMLGNWMGWLPLQP